MIERFLFSTLQTGLAAVRDDPQIVEDLFSQYDLSSTEIRKIQDLMISKFPEVKHQFARREDTPPMVCIVLAGESEKDYYLGDFAVQKEDGTEINSAIWEHSYDIMIVTEHPDHTNYLYEICKAIITTAPLGDFGIFSIYLSGKDLMLDPNYVPEHWFVRQLSMTLQREFQSIDRLIALQKAFRVRGIHVDKSGSSGDVGGVRTLVTPYVETEE